MGTHRSHHQAPCPPRGRPGHPRHSSPLPALVALAALLAVTGCAPLGADGDAAPATAPAAPPVTTSPAGTPVGPATPEAAPASPAAGATAPTTFRSAAAEIGPVVWATAVDPATKAPLDRVSGFRTDAPAIYAVLPIARLRSGTTIGASWSYNDTPIDGFVSTVRAERDERDVWIEFHLTRAGAETWPPGTYAIAVTVDGQPAQAATVSVAPPPP